MTIESAKGYICPFMSTTTVGGLCNTSCKADKCMAWITTDTFESVPHGKEIYPNGPKGEGWEYDEEEDVWYRKLPREKMGWALQIDSNIMRRHYEHCNIQK